MSELTEAYWTDRYKEDKTGWDIGSAGPLKNVLDGIENKKAKILIPGAGFGHEADYAWQKGFKNIHILDFSPNPLEILKKRIPGIPENQFHCEDFFDHDGEYDYILEQTFFCALDPSLREKYVSKMNSLLKENGMLTGVLFDFPLESGPPFGGNSDIYKSLFDKQFKIDTLEPCSFSIPKRNGRELYFKCIKA